MKSERNILIAFLLNISFSVIELFGGIFTSSVAILSDAVHDLGDAVSIGISYFLEKKSRKKPDDKHTYGYLRYSVLGATITNTILAAGSVIVIINAIMRIINPEEINHNGMIIFALLGVVINFAAACFTSRGDSLNQKAVNLHMLEDVLGWAVVLIGAFVIKFTGFVIVDPLMSIAVAVFILINALKSLKSIVDLFLEKTPEEIEISELKEHLLEIQGVIDVHHIHIWSMDGVNNYATMHVVTQADDIAMLKNEIKQEFKEHGIVHTTIEIEGADESCADKECRVEENHDNHHHHHHHHH